MMSLLKNGRQRQMLLRGNLDIHSLKEKKKWFSMFRFVLLFNPFQVNCIEKGEESNLILE